MKELPRELTKKEIADIYVRRLVDGLRLIRQIDGGDFGGITEYSSGELKRIRAKNGGWVDTDEYVSVPIYQDGAKKGVRYAVSKMVFEDGEELSRWGARETVEKVVFDLKMKRDEECEGK